ncbi:uncharacterized protein isoform X2 [Rhodnius prolixus]|uniref:uncharacterized protein isoform X2 n=1 Tax=Rhodnius prolixus TaxID=13249 RepID=UPI003D18EDBA
MRRHHPSSPEVEWDYRSSSGKSKGRERTRRRRSRSSSRGRRSHSSSSSSTGSSSRSSHSSSSRRSDYGRKRSGSRSPKHHSGDKYRSSSSPRSGRTNVDPRYSIKEGVSDHNHGSWYTNQSYGPGQEGYTAQASYSSTLSGNFNYQSQGFGSNYHQGYQGYESSSYYQTSTGEFPQQSSHGEILQKLKSIDNVIEMLTGIIGDAENLPEVIKTIMAKETPKKPEKKKHSDSPDSNHKKIPRSKSSETPSPSPSESRTNVNLVHYDPELHWCADCDAFPRSMTDYLQHLHSDEHRKATAKTSLDDLPWHKAPFRENSPVFHNELPNKRIPIRGVQFLKPSTAWFCAICKTWLGDLHCAANHLRGQMHSQRYNEFTTQNPHWEVDWITDRMRAYERKCGSEPGGKKSISGTSGAADGNRGGGGNTALDIASISDQLMQMIANANRQRNDSSEQQSSDSRDADTHVVSKKSKKSKKKKSKKKKKEEDIVPPAAIVKTSARGKITINLPPAGGIASRSPEESEDIAATLLKTQELVKKSKHAEDSPDGLYDNINQTIRGAAAERQKSKSLLPSALSEYGDMNEDDISFKKSSESPRDVKYGPREPPRKEKRSNFSSTSSLPPQSHKNSNSNYRYEKESSRRGEYSYGKERRSERDHYDYGYKEAKSPRSSKERHIYKEKKEQRSSQSKSKEPQKSPEHKVKPEKEAERKPFRVKNMLEKASPSPEEAAETIFEKRTSESAAKKKDPKKALPKSKLPFIGRMPILKKKVESKIDDIVEEEKKKEEKREGEFNLAEAMAKAEAAAAVVNQQILESEVVPLPKSTLIISKRPRLTEPEVVKKDAVLFKGKVTDDNLTEQDMDIEEDHPKDELHKDFKDALDLLFPEEKKPGENEEVAANAVSKEVVTAPEIESSYDVHMMTTQAGTPYDIGMYHPPAATAPQPTADQGQYIGYYDQSMYMHQAAYMMGGYDPNQGMQAQAYPTAVEPNAQYLQQQQAAVSMPPPLPVATNNGMATTEQMSAEQASDADEQESTGEEDKDSSKDGQPMKKKNPLSQRMRRHLKKKAELAKAKEDELAESMEMEAPPPPICSFNAATVDKSDLAMLGIEEDDITAQSFT